MNPYMIYILECEMRSLILDELNNVLGEGLLDPLFPHLVGSGPTYAKVNGIVEQPLYNYYSNVY